MALLNFHYGLVKDLPATVTNGNLYITTDTQGLYVDLEGSRVHVSDFIQVANAEALNALGVYNTSVFYYVEGSNALLKYIGVTTNENGETQHNWKQLNSTADLQVALNALTERVAQNEADIDALESADTALSGRIDGINATNVSTTQKFTVTSAVGNYHKGQEIEAKDLQSLIINMLCQDIDPIKHAPSISVSLNGAGSKEVGTEFTPSYTINTNAGFYDFDDNASTTDDNQASGVIFSNFYAEEVGRPDGATAGNKSTQSGSFTKFTVTETTSYKVKGKASHTAGNMPKTFLNADCPSKQIAAEDPMAFVNSSAVTGYRSYFYGYKKGTDTLLDVNNLTSADIRALASKNTTTKPSTITTEKMQQMFFAFPAESGVADAKVKTVAVANSTNGAPQTVEHTTVEVEGANGYEAITYDVFYVSNASAESGTTKFNITYTSR